MPCDGVWKAVALEEAVTLPLPNIIRRAWKHGGIAAVVSILVGFAFG